MAAEGKDSKLGMGSADATMALFGVAGIYGSFMYYGLLQESVTKYVSDSGERLERTWFLQTVEALANVAVGAVGLLLTGGFTAFSALPMKGFAITGLTQVCAKAFTTQAMLFGVSFPVATLAKSAKMVPVMIGTIVLTGKQYAPRKYLQVAMIIGGTVMVNMSKKKASAGGSELSGLACLAVALTCDGITGGLQDDMKESFRKASGGKKLKPYEMMTLTNVSMCMIAFVVSLALGQFFDGLAFLLSEPKLTVMVAQFALCSALGQSFIFFTIATFDPLVTTTVTTTRKIFSVLLSIFLHGHPVNELGWAGIGVASLGILGELQEKMSKKKPSAAKK